MKTTWKVWLGTIGSALVALRVAVSLCAEPSEGESRAANGRKSATPSVQVEAKDRVAIAVARDRAKTMHDIYAATLDVMHHRYFHREKSVVPARAMEDVFSEIKRQSSVESRWISVNMTAMSIDHEPKSDFEKRAAKEIAAGKSDVEVVEEGYYRRAGAIALTSGCISCHGGFLKEASKTAKYAGLVISIPVISESGETK